MQFNAIFARNYKAEGIITDRIVAQILQDGPHDAAVMTYVLEWI